MPNIEDLLCLALKHILENCLTDSFNQVYEYLIRIHQQYANISLTSIIREIAKFPTGMQYVLAEHLYRVNNVNGCRMMIFFIKKVNESLDYITIDKTWADEFIELACSAPFIDFLSPYIRGEDTDLRRLLGLVTDKITLMDLPEGVLGVTFYNLTMCIKLFPEQSGSKGATFFVYLRELAHYLQRVSGAVIKECEGPKSMTNFNVPEVGYQLEQKLFGHRLLMITGEAADYLVTPLPRSYEEFIQEFEKENTVTDDTSVVINLSSSGGTIYLGGCGSRFRSHKPDSESSDDD